MLCASSVSAFTDQRRQWWEQRLEDLASQRNEKGNNPALHKKIIALIDRETSRGKKILALYNRADKGASPAGAAASSSATNDTAAIAARTLKPLIAVHLLKELTGETVSRSRPESVKKTIRNEISALLREEGNFSDDTLLQEILTIDIPRSEWDSLYAEYFMTRLMLQKKDISSALTKDITASAITKFPPSGNPPQEKAVVRYTADVFAEKINTCSAQSKNDSQLLRETWSWADISTRIKNDCRHYRKIIDMLHKTEGNIPFPKLRYYLRNIPSLDIVYFTGISRLMRTKSGGNTPSGSGQLDTVFEKIDHLRRKAGPALNGKEKQEYFNTLKTRFDTIITRYAPETGPVPSAEEYRDLSLQFLTWVSSTRRRESRELTAIYRTKISRTKEYADFIGTLYQEASDIPTEAGSREHLHFKAALQHYPKFFSYIESGLSIPSYYNKNLPPATIRSLRTRRHAYTQYRAGVQRDIRESSNEYRRHVIQGRRTKKQRRVKRNDRLARYDVELMTSTLNDYVSAFTSLTYGKRALVQYARVYGKLKKDIKGEMTPLLRKCMEQNSLFPAAPSIKLRKISAEYASKKHLRNEIRSLISRIAHLENFYDRYNINVHNIFDRSEASAIENRISTKTEIPVGDWSLNEENFLEIDRKLAQSLFNARKKSIWSDTAERTHTIQVPGTDISISIPDGWSRKDSLSRKSAEMTTMTFSSIGDTASIDVATVPAGENTLRTINSEWMKIQRATAVKTKFGRNHTIDYFWSLARDNTSSIRESYIFQKGATAVIISGSTTRTRYNFFKKKLDRVFESVHTP